MNEVKIVRLTPKVNDVKVNPVSTTTPKKIEKYGAKWPAESSALDIEMACIKAGGAWVGKSGGQCGAGLFEHYRNMQDLIWPHLDRHRWSDLCLREQVRNKVTVLMGAASCGKTHEAAKFALSYYFCWPDETIVLISSTDLRGLELRVWGEIKMLHEQAITRFPKLSGELLESKHAITTDVIDEDGDTRDLRKGIIGIPCIQGGKFVGLGKYSGIKQKRVLLIADEAQFMGSSFLSAFSNLDKNECFQATVLGNPSDVLDPLGRAAEPKDGWSAHMEPTKTECWDTRFMNGRCVNLIGTDSPNFDYPPDQPAKYPYLISRAKIETTEAFFGKDTLEYSSQCIGSMRVSTMSRRVITTDLCRQFKAQEPVVWAGKKLTRIYAVDAAYGGDRCIGGYVEFGETVDGKVKVLCQRPKIIPISVRSGESPEDQIAAYVKDDCEHEGILPQFMFHDATGRGSLGTALARIWSAMTNPVEFGGAATKRPVSLDMFVMDPVTHVRRLKRCDEHYSKFVTELWFSIRYLIEAGQMAGLPTEVMEELAMREWYKVGGQGVDRIEVESKVEMKKRAGRSPDLADWLSIAIEGCRRNGLQISRLAAEEDEGPRWDWLNAKADSLRKMQQQHQLTYA
jgi:hypothetical protein